MLYLTLRHYEYIIAIAAAGSLSAAAAVLNVSQPSLSTALTRIEARLGHALFLRGRGQGFAITPQGQRVVAEARALVAQAARIEAAGRHPLPQRHVTLGCFDDLAPFVLAPALALIRARFAHITVQPRIGRFDDLQEAMLAGAVDLAITWDIGLDARFKRADMGRVQPHVFVAADDPLAKAADVSLSDLADRALILSDDGLSVRHMMGLFQRHGLRPSVVHRAGTVEVMRALAAHGEGVGLSYSVPPGDRSYDGKPLVTLPLRDADASERVIVAQLGPWQEGDQLTMVRDAVLAAGLLGRA
tara:strand:- start:53732 stop:54634 length:903 start_codon:yes stop_codon:yes gene_type:complete